MRILSELLLGIFWLILLYLVLTNWNGANTLLGTGATSSGTVIKDLQGR